MARHFGIPVRGHIEATTRVTGSVTQRLGRTRRRRQVREWATVFAFLLAMGLVLGITSEDLLKPIGELLAITEDNTG